jgi:hypothetical protein
VALRLTDEEIQRLLTARKVLPLDFRKQLVLKAKHGHDEREMEIRGDDGTEYRLILRQSKFNKLDFSVILGYRLPGMSKLFRLRRYNGKHGEHSNRLEGTPAFYGFHVHTATARYQELGMDEDTFADPTDRYSDLPSALQCMLRECGFEPLGTSQGTLFPEEWQ